MTTYTGRSPLEIAEDSLIAIMGGSVQHGFTVAEIGSHRRVGLPVDQMVAKNAKLDRLANEATRLASSEPEGNWFRQVRELFLNFQAVRMLD